MRRVFSMILLDEVKDARMAHASVSRVSLTPDLTLAKVFIAPLEDQAESQALAASLNRAKGFFRRQLADRMRLRIVPELAFAVDRELETQMRVDQVIHHLHEPS